MSTAWIPAAPPAAEEYADIRYEKSAAPEQGIAKITIARPEVRNAFRPRTVIEMSRALEDAREDPEIARAAPYSTPVRRLDEAAAAKHPVLRQAR